MTRRHRLALLPLATLALPTLALAAAPPSEPAPIAPAGRGVVAAHGQLRVEGTHVVDRAGRPVALRGASLFWSQWQPQFYNRATIRALADDWKADVVRAAIAVDGGKDFPVDGILEHYETERARAFAVIDAAIAEEIYVVVDWHAHRPHPAEAIRFFTDVARKYGRYPNIIYETWNEPYPGFTWQRDIRPYHMQVVPAIRAIDPDALIVAGTGNWSQDVDDAARDPLPFANVAYTLHYYANQKEHQQPLMDKAAAASARVALFVTEQGYVDASGDGPINREWSRRWWDFLNARHISHLNWSISTKPEGASTLRVGATPRGGLDAGERTPAGAFLYDYLRGWNHRPAG